MRWRRWIFLPWCFWGFAVSAFEFQIDESVPHFTLIAPHAHDETRYVLMRPDGKKYHLHRLDESVVWRHQDGFDVIVVSQPMLGPWVLSANTSMPEITLWRHLQLAPLLLPEVLYSGEVLTISPQWRVGSGLPISGVSPLQLTWQWQEDTAQILSQNQLIIDLPEGQYLGQWQLPSHVLSPLQSITILPSLVDISVMPLSDPERFQVTLTAAQPLLAQWEMRVTTPFQSFVETNSWPKGARDWVFDVPISPSEGLYRWQGKLNIALGDREVTLPLWDHNEIVLPILPEAHAVLNDGVTWQANKQWQTALWLFLGNTLILLCAMAWRFRRRG